jgi:hypothetical protein
MDKDGVLYFNGTPIDDPWTLGFFHRNLRVDEDGRFVAICDGEYCYLSVEDAPYVVTDVVAVAGDKGAIERFDLIFGGGSYRERLDPSTLMVGEGNVLYCRVRRGRFVARFSRRAYYELAKYVEFDNEPKRFFLRVGDGKYFILAGEAL